jgi:phosphate transport system protein
MSHVFQQELTRLRREFTVYATRCLEALEHACEVLRDRDTALAKRVIEGDDQVDEEEIQIESACVRLMSLHQPVAHDLRLLVTVLKMNYDLERIADHATNISWLANRIVQRGGRIPPQLLQLSDRVVAGSRSVFQAFLDQDLEQARGVVLGDAEVDRLDKTVRHEVHDLLAAHGEVNSALDVFRISRELERVGDHLSNMAEETIYLITGEIVRHHDPAGAAAAAPARRQEFRSPAPPPGS